MHPPVCRRLALVGMGHVGRNLLRVLESQRDLLVERHGVAFSVVALADSRGAAWDRAGLDPARALALKERGASVAALEGAGRPGMQAPDLVRRAPADVVVDATPANLETGQPGLELVRAALGRQLAVVLANKAPLALAYGELAAASDLGDPAAPPLRFSACVGGAMPTVNLGLRDLAGARVLRVEAVLNGTTQYMLRAMEEGRSFAEALADAARRGLTETDPSLDVDGWDAASKLVIVANSVLRQPATLRDVRVRGLREVTPEGLRAARESGRRIVLLSLAERGTDPAGPFRLSVEPTALPLTHPLARMDADEMGVVYHTDIAGRAHATTLERDPVPTAAAILRDLIEIATSKPLGPA
jgi:homoserine dehydrogenase